MEIAVKPANFDRWSIRTNEKNASVRKISGQYPQLSKTKKRKSRKTILKNEI